MGGLGKQARASDHGENARLDENGHCGDCTFLFSYDRETVEQAATILRSRETLADLLDSAADGWTNHRPHTATTPAARQRQAALAAARNILGQEGPA